MADRMPTHFHVPAGFTTSLDFAMYFNQWATAFRWRRAYRDALERNRARAAA